MPYFIKADVELQAIVPLKSLKKIGEEGLREVAIKQDVLRSTLIKTKLTKAK